MVDDPTISLLIQVLHKAASFPPLLFIMYTDSCRPSQVDSLHLVKFSDDTALLPLLQGPQSDHSCALSSFVKWCDDNHLDLNVIKTKESISQHCSPSAGLMDYL